MPKTEFVSINDLAKKFQVNKSRINFWVTEGLIKSRGTIGRTKFFDKEYALTRVAELVKERGV